MFGRGRLAGINVGDDANVANFAEIESRTAFGHSVLNWRGYRRADFPECKRMNDERLF